MPTDGPDRAAPPTATHGNFGHVPALDGLRGVAILWVIPHNLEIFPPVHNWLLPAMELAHTGWIGVQLFFALSGFLITGYLLDSRGAQNYYSAFFGRRMLRILPLYYLALLLFLVVLPAVTTLSPQILATYANQTWLWTFLINWKESGPQIYWFPHFWSLAVEEQFYLVWPLVIALVPIKRLLWLLPAIAVVSLLTRPALFDLGVSSGGIYTLTVSRMDALALGALAAAVLRVPATASFIEWHATSLMAFAVAALLAGAVLTHAYNYREMATITYGYTILAAGLAAIVLVCGSNSSSRTVASLKRALSIAPLRSAGKYSYAMYVWHLPIVRLAGPRTLAAVKPLGFAYPIAYTIVIVMLSFGAAWISYHLFEKHFLRLKRYFVPRLRK